MKVGDYVKISGYNKRFSYGKIEAFLNVDDNTFKKECINATYVAIILPNGNSYLEYPDKINVTDLTDEDWAVEVLLC